MEFHGYAPSCATETTAGRVLDAQIKEVEVDMATKSSGNVRDCPYREQDGIVGVHEHDGEDLEVPPPTESRTHALSSGNHQVFHGPFSPCLCHACVRDAKIEVEKRFTDDTLVTRYIAKLEAMVNNLQVGFTANGMPQPPKPAYPLDRRAGSFNSLHTLNFPRPRSRSPGVVVGNREIRLSSRSCSRSPQRDGPRVQIRRKKKVQGNYPGYEHIKDDNDFDEREGGKLSKKLKHGYVLTVYREFDRHDGFWRRSVEIISSNFVDLLQRISPYDIDLPLVDDVLHMVEPLSLLFHNRKYLIKYVADNDHDGVDDAIEQSVAHARLILNFMRDEFADASKTLDDLESEHPSGLINFPDLWLLYSPGTIVFSTDSGEHEAFVVDSVRGCDRRQRTPSGRQSLNKLELTCWSIDYDGEVFGRVWSTHRLPRFDGTKEIVTLDVVPEGFLPNAGEIKASLKGRGKQFWALQGQHYQEYTGEMWSQHAPEESIRVMVDHLTYQRKKDWPIVINRKKGPSGALSKNWKDNRFTNRGRSRLYDNGHDRRYSPRCQPAIIYSDEERDYSPERG